MKRITRYQAWNTKTGKISALLLASFLIIALTFGGCAVAGSNEQTTQVPTPVTNGTATAVFQIDKLLIYPEKGYPGQEVTIMAAVTNTGGSNGEYIAELEINNTIEEQKNVTLPAKEMQVLNFSTFKSEPGTYNVSLGGLTGQFEVLDQAASPQSVPGGSITSSCCEQDNASTGQAASGDCCATSSPVTLGSPTARPQVKSGRGGCCGGG